MANKRDWHKIDKNLIQQYVQESTSLGQVLDKLNIPLSGSAYRHIKELIDEYKLDVSHFPDLNGSSWMKNNFNYERFRNGHFIKAAEAKPALVHLRGHKCERCGRTHWLGELIPLEVHHKDGDRRNNDLTNLELLCANCHALTDNWRGKGINKGQKKVSDEEIIEALKTCPNVHQVLNKVGLKQSGLNYSRVYKVIVEHNLTEYLKFFKKPLDKSK